MSLFGTSGVRDKADALTPELTLAVGKALGSYLGSGKIVAIGHDVRKSSKRILESVVAGLFSSGIKVRELGLATTPTVAWHVRKYHLSTGVVITASHNPPEYNGIKFLDNDGSGYVRAKERQIEDILRSQKFAVDEHAVGEHRDMNALRDHIDMIAGSVKLRKRLKVVVDPANSVGGLVTPRVLRELGCDVVMVNGELDGDFPGRDPEPRNDTLTELKRRVVEENADMGVAHCGDADRCVAVDEQGNFVKLDTLLAILAKYETLRNPGRVVTTFEASMAVDDVVSGEVMRTPVGDVYVSQELRKGGVFGGEPCGAFVFPEKYLCPDGPFAAARLAELVSRKSLSSLVSEIPEYPVLREKFPCADKSTTMGRVTAFAQNEGDVDTRDGVMVKYAAAVVLVRPSGTEPLLRLRVEAKSDTVVQELYNKWKENIEKVIV
jgi:phosphoglucosamine mutase